MKHERERPLELRLPKGSVIEGYHNGNTFEEPVAVPNESLKPYTTIMLSI